MERWLGGAALLGMVSYPVIVELQMYMNSGTYFSHVAGWYG